MTLSLQRGHKACNKLPRNIRAAKRKVERASHLGWQKMDDVNARNKTTHANARHVDGAYKVASSVVTCKATVTARRACLLYTADSVFSFVVYQTFLFQT